MTDLRVRPMTEAEFSAFRARAVDEYADAKVSAGQWRAADAPTLSERAFAELLPTGLATDGMVLCVGERDDGTVVGSFWVALSGPTRSDEAWIYDIQVAADHRGNGYGRALLQAAEDEAGRRGAAAIGLNVFGYNAVARSLYESAGWVTQAVQMRKPLV